MSQYAIQSFYSFKSFPKENLEAIKGHLQSLSEIHEVVGLVILATEGINTTLCGAEADLDAFVAEVQSLLSLGDLEIKKSNSDFPAFKRFNVKLRDEIVTLDRPDINPLNQKRRHLSPDEWDEMMAKEDTVVIDTRNTYETIIGKFKGAIDPEIAEFTDFPKKVASMNLDKDKNYLIYCTGGIRCEKAIYSMEDLGFKNVFQLDGGILNYLEQKPNQNFEGECFVFDARVSLDQNLQPSQKFSLCPHCGDVAQVDIVCRKCDSESKLCPECLDKVQEQPELETCSKNCAYHYKRDPEHKSPQQKRHYHFS